MKLTTPVNKWSQCGGHAETPRALATEQCWEWLANPQKSAFNTKKTTNSVFQRAAIFYTIISIIDCRKIKRVS
jgi:hypothetical protein